MSISEDYYILVNQKPRAVRWPQYLEWLSKDFEETRRIAKTTIGEVEVSTVFLSIDHSWGGPPPILFETMVFGGDHDEYQWRYATWDQAVAGHEVVVAAVRGEGEWPE